MIQADEILRALEQADDAFIITDLSGSIEYASPSMKRLTGYAPDELIGQSTRIFRSNETPAAVYTDLWDTILEGREWSGILYNQTKDGEIYPERISIVPVVDEEQRLRRFLARKRHSTQWKQLEPLKPMIPADSGTEKYETELMEVIGSLSSEFQSALQMVLGFSQLLGDDFKEIADDTQREFFDIVIRTSQRLLRTIQDTLFYSELATDRVAFSPERINVAKELKGVLAAISPMVTSKEVRIIKAIKDTGAVIQADRGSFGLVVSHLLINAMKFTKRGVITIGLQHTETESVIWIVDTGVGISDQFKMNLFKPFRQEELGFNKDFEGAGLGLAIVQKLISSMGGNISFESHKGSGSSFVVTFPLAGYENVELRQ